MDSRGLEILTFQFTLVLDFQVSVKAGAAKSRPLLRSFCHSYKQMTLGRILGAFVNWADHSTCLAGPC